MKRQSEGTGRGSRLRRAFLSLILAVLALAVIAPAAQAFTFVTKWGTPGTSNGQFVSPADVATDAAGNVYVIDLFPGRVQKFDSSGNFISAWGSNGSGNGQFNGAHGIAVRGSTVYVADSGNDRIQMFSLTGTFLGAFGSSGSGPGQFNFPTGIRTDSTGNVYVADNSTGRIQKFTATGTHLATWAGMAGPWGIAIDSADNVYVVEQGVPRVRKFNSSGTLLQTIGGAGMNNPFSIAVSSSGDIFVGNIGNSTIRQWAPNGAQVGTVATSGSANGQVIHPIGMIFHAPTSHVYVAEYTVNHRISKFSLGDNTPPTLNLPANITTEADGPGGSEVSFTVTATDNVDPNPTVNCAPPSGSLFAIGTTNVNCTATDSSGNVANGSFTVTVTDTVRSDLEIEKFASHTKASPGENVTYSFRVTNHGPSAANNVTVRDPGSAHLNFISGDAGCSVVASEIVCDFGTLANGATQTKNVVLQLHPSHHSGEAPSQHDLDILKLEQFVSVPGNELNYPEHSLSCPAGYTATDGSARTDSVDQGTGTRPGEHDVENLHFVRSESNAANRRQWDFTLQNHATGQAQAHLFIVCLRDTTSSANGHSHNLIHHPRVTGVLPIGAAGGRHEITLTCPVNTVAIAPSFEFTTTGPAPPAGGPNGPHGAQYRSEQSADGRSWTFGFQTAAAARVEVSIRCLGRETGSAAGHFEALNFHHVYKRATVGPFGGFGNSGPWSENRVECPVHYKGITATWDLPRNVKTMGSTPEPINRDFRIFNKSSQPKFAHLDLLCLKTRTMDDLNGGSVRNHATVYGDEPDWNFANNLDFWDLEDPPLDPSGGGSADGSGGGGSGGGADSSGDGSGGDAGAGESGSAVDSGGAGEPGTALGDDHRQAKLENCVKRALKIGKKKKRRKAAKKCRSRFGAS